MANMAVSRIKREFKEVIKSEEVSGMRIIIDKIANNCMNCMFGVFHSVQYYVYCTVNNINEIPCDANSDFMGV